MLHVLHTRLTAEVPHEVAHWGLDKVLKIHDFSIGGINMLKDNPSPTVKEPNSPLSTST